MAELGRALVESGLAAVFAFWMGRCAVRNFRDAKANATKNPRHREEDPLWRVVQVWGVGRIFECRTFHSLFEECGFFFHAEHLAPKCLLPVSREFP